VALQPVEAPHPSEPPRRRATDGGRPRGHAEPASALTKGALAAYRDRDFAGAEHQASGALAGQLHALRAVYDRATADETHNPAAAVKEYQDAMAMDARIGRGLHAGYFRGKLGRLEVLVSQQAFGQGRYDLAYQAVVAARSYGGGDGGMAKQLEAKAAELVQRGQAVERSNLTQAKTLWRMVVRMVPQSSPNYAKASSLLGNAAGAHKDDED
jgi:hypothetical protein